MRACVRACVCICVNALHNNYIFMHATLIDCDLGSGMYGCAYIVNQLGAGCGHPFE